MLEAYCWPRSVEPGQLVGLHVSTDAAGFEVTVTRDGAEPLEVWRGTGTADAPPDPRGRERERLRMARRAADPGRRLAQRLLRRHADRRRRARRGVPRGAGGRPRACADPARALDQHLRRLQRLGRTVAVHGRHAGLDAPPDGAGVPDEARAAPAQDAARSPTARRCGSSSGPNRSACRCGAAARDGGTGSARSRTGPSATATAVDVAISTDLETVPGLLDGYRSFVCVGHDEYWSWGMREALDAHTARGRQRGDLQRQHVLLAGPIRSRRRHDDVLQVPLRRGPGARHTDDARLLTGPWSDRRIGWPETQHDRAHVHARRVFALRAGRAARLGRLSRSIAPSTGSSRAPTCATATRSGSSTRSSPTRWTGAR